MLYMTKTMPFDTLEDIRNALRHAVLLEHATIPPYLTALYSLKPRKNDAIAQLLKGIVFEEMQHMTLAANILNAIDGNSPDAPPLVDDPAFIPKYPGGLPFAIGDRDGNVLEVILARFSLDLVHDVFMEIEEPENVPHFPVKTLALGAPAPTFQTIGQFYTAIKDALRPEWFTGDPAWQVQGIVTPVRNLDEAHAAIDLIVEQGEGTTQTPLAGHELAHYFKFAEIYNQKTLVADPSVKEGYSYSGPPIPFDPSEVWPIVANAASDLYAPGSLARAESDVFNKMYSDLLRALHVTFQGQPGFLDTAIGLMFDLKLQALKLMAIELGDGTNAAPCFEYAP